jgi:hypothetical protein
MKIEVYRKDYEVMVNGIECKVNKQSSKGPNHEVVDISKVVGDNYQKWLSLSLIPNNTTTQIELKPRKIVDTQKYVLTEEEQAQIAEYQSKIDAIIESAKARYVPSKKNAEDYSIEELQALISRKQKEAMELQAKLK